MEEGEEIMWGFDIDGCIVEIDSLLLKYIKELYGYSLEGTDITCYVLEECLPLSREQIVKCIDKTIADVDNLFPIPGSIEFLRYYHLISGKIIQFITARWDKESTYKWLNKWLVDIPFDVIFSKGRYKIDPINEFGIDIFVEDKLKTALNLAQNNIKVLLLDQAWNQLKELPPNIIRMKDWGEIKDYYYCNQKEK